MMHVIILTWEYPLRTIGTLAEPVKDLARELTKKKVTPYIVTYHNSLTGKSNERGPGDIIQVVNPVHTHTSVLTRFLTLNQEVERIVANIYYNPQKQANLIDVHDWQFIPAAVTLKKALTIPFIYSIESLENHRSHNGNSPLNMAIKSIEWLGMTEADKIIVKSDGIQKKVIRLSKVPGNKIKVIRPTTPTWIKDIFKTYKNVVGDAHK
jgi:hypothetical protein